MKLLIIGLGNPGEKYLLTPHNIGWIVIDAYAHYLNILWSKKTKLTALITENKNILLAKPTTYMNLSGQSVQKIMNYYRIDQDNLLVIHDDTDLPFLSLRFQKNRGPAGHNGLKSINQELGSQNYTRLRIGMKALDPNTLAEYKAPLPITEPKTPISEPQKRQVLKPFTKKEQELLSDFLNQAVSALEYFIQKGLEKTANYYNNRK